MNQGQQQQTQQVGDDATVFILIYPFLTKEGKRPITLCLTL